MRVSYEKVLGNKWVIFGIMTLCNLVAFSGNIHEYGLSKFLLGCIVLVEMLICIYVFRNDWFESLIDWVVKWRFLLCLLVFIVCVSLQVHGSSIGMYDVYFPNKIDNNVQTVIFGSSKPIRGDEWSVLTPYYFSQKFNDYQKISYQMSISGQDMIIGYNAPVWDLTVLAKPLVWGYLLFGNAYGLSWYWCSKTLLLLLSSYEIAAILTKGNKKAGILSAILVTFGPSTLWWFAPHMPDVLLWAMCLFSIAYHFLANEKKWVRNVLTMILPFVLLEFVIALFPSFQVGVGFFILVVLFGVYKRDQFRIFSNRAQVIRIVVAVGLSLALLAYFVIGSKDALVALMNTSYPGDRVSLGGGATIKDLFTDLATPFLSYTNASPYVNFSEDSTYIHFGVFFLFLAPLIFSQQKKEGNRDYIVGICMVVVILIDIFFMIFGFPEWLARITLYSKINRMKMIVGFCSILFTVWSVNAIKNLKEPLDRKYCALAIAFYAILNFSFIDATLTNYLPRYVYYAEILVFVIILYSFSIGKQAYGYFMTICLVIFASLSINPIARGTESLTNHPSAQKIAEIIEEDDSSYWIAHANDIYSSYLLANGAKTLSAVNFYPDMGKWSVIDADGDDLDKYNRYAHIVTTISTDGENHIDYGLTADSVSLQLSMATMDELQIKYILSSEDLSAFSEGDYYLEEIYIDDNVRIYELKKD